MNFNKSKSTFSQYDVLTKKYLHKDNLKRLFSRKDKSLGRASGRIVAWHRGGGVKRAYRHLLTNYHISKYGIVRSIEYDPNRSSFVSLVQDEKGSFFYILTHSNAKIDDILYFSSTKKTVYRKRGDFLRLRYAPIGTPIYNIERFPGSGPTYSKSAGTSSTLLTKDVLYGKIKLPSGEEKLFDLDCQVTMGVPSNSFSRFNKKYKAGTNRLLNWRPVVRGTAMNPIDHPHGGGAGKTAPGRPSVSPWGKLTKGLPTRNKKLNNKFIIKRI